MLLDMILKLLLGNVLAELLVADWALVVTLINVAIDVLLDLQEALGGELHLTKGALEHAGRNLWLGKTVESRDPGAELGDGEGGGVDG